jgi:YVTN family beta-propeller protein
MKTKQMCVFSLLVLMLAACKKEKEEEEVVVTPGSKVFIGNEGNFGSSNADVSYIDGNGVIHNDVYQSINGLPLGDVLQSLTIEGNRAFAVLNNSSKVQIFNSQSFAPIYAIEGIEYPRYLVHADASKAYLSSGAGSGTVHVIDKSDYSISQTIAVGNGPENMTLSNGQLYVCNSGGWGNDNTVSVVNTSSDMVTATITVSDQPVDAVTDYNGDVWVLCKGQTLYDDSWNVIGHTDARLYHIDELTNQVIDYAVVGANSDHPFSMAVSKNGHDIYIVNGGLWKYAIDEANWTELVTGAFGTVDVAEKDGRIWLTSLNDFVNPATVSEYTLTGSLVRTVTAGVGANCVIAQ